MTSNRTTIEEHPARVLTRDERVQRCISETRMAKLMRKLDLDAIGTVIVSRRADGSMVVLDGGHRLTTLVRSDMGEWPVRCEVHHGLSLAREAQLFLEYNDRLVVNIIDRFNMAVLAEDPESVIIDREVRNAGFVLANDHSRANSITCVGTLQKVYRGTTDGDSANLTELRDTLRIIAEAWGYRRSVLKEPFDGIAQLLIRHGDAIDQDLLVKKLQRLPGGAVALVSRSKQIRDMRLERNGSLAALKAARDLYNDGLRGSRKLPEN